MSRLKARIARLEAATAANDEFYVVQLYHGLSEEEAMTLRFGEAGKPKDGTFLLISGGIDAVIPGDEIPREWAIQRDSPEFARIWAKLMAAGRSWGTPDG